MNSHYVTAAVFGALFVVGCAAPRIDQFYEKHMKKLSAGKGSVLGKTGGVVVHEMDFFYSGSDGGELRASDLAGLDAGVRRTVIKKELLRRAVISAGVKEGIYADDEAVAYLLPRVERLLEDYYYYRKADFHGIQRSTVLNTPDNASLQEFARTNPIVKSAGADVKMLAAERDRMARRITEKRFTEARGRVIQEFLASHPRLEVSE